MIKESGAASFKNAAKNTFPLSTTHCGTHNNYDLKKQKIKSKLNICSFQFFISYSVFSYIYRILIASNFNKLMVEIFIYVSLQQSFHFHTMDWILDVAIIQEAQSEAVREGREEVAEAQDDHHKVSNKFFDYYFR